MGLYLLFLIVPLVFGLLMQASLKRTFARNAQIEVASGLSGAQVARAILDANGLHGVPVEPSMGGPLSDHYDPRKRSVHLSEPVFAGRSVSASAVAASSRSRSTNMFGGPTPRPMRRGGPSLSASCLCSRTGPSAASRSFRP